MDINVIRLIHPASFQMVDIQNLVSRAFESMKDTMNTDLLMDTMMKRATDPNVCVIAGQEDLKWKGLVIINDSVMYREPQVFHFYNKGSSKLRKALLDSMVEWVKERGYNGFWTSNINGTETDSAFKRLFKRAGKPKKMGTVFRFEVE